MPPPRILVTGPPGIGKTTLVRRVVERLHGKRLTGFYTEELRGRGGRTGFRIVTLDGREARLATVGGGGPTAGGAVHRGRGGARGGVRGAAGPGPASTPS